MSLSESDDDFLSTNVNTVFIADDEVAANFCNIKFYLFNILVLTLLSNKAVIVQIMMTTLITYHKDPYNKLKQN